MHLQLPSHSFGRLLAEASRVRSIFVRRPGAKVNSRSCLLLWQKRCIHSISTPIFYVNADPHIGHMYTAVLADATHRWHLLKGEESHLYTGTDEHGLKIQQSAAKLGIHPYEHCHNNYRKFKLLSQKSYINYSDFIRTTKDRHKKAVHHFWNVLAERGHIYKGSYSGWYCISDETFVPESDIIERITDDGRRIKVSVTSGHPVEWTTEENYLFRLTNFIDQLKTIIPDTGLIQPNVFERDVVSRLDTYTDLSVSRQRDRLQWGIPVPGDHSQTIYVWLDALVNYLTVCGYPDNPTSSWPMSCHIIGKDILTFHAVYWLAFLLAADMPLPKRIFCHSHWTVDGQKMSKSIGNVVDPFDRIERYTTDGLRFYLLRKGIPHSDSDYSDDKVITLLNDELSNNLGNLLSRTTAVALNPEQRWPLLGAAWIDFLCNASTDEHLLINSVKSLPDKVDRNMCGCNIYKAVDEIIAVLRNTNAFFQNREPWKDKKSDIASSKIRLDITLGTCLEILRICGILLQPIVPSIAIRLLDTLGMQNRTFKYAVNNKFVSSEFVSSELVEFGTGDKKLFARLEKSKSNEHLTWKKILKKKARKVM